MKKATWESRQASANNEDVLLCFGQTDHRFASLTTLSKLSSSSSNKKVQPAYSTASIMSSALVDEINRALFFTDVPDGTLEHRPREVTAARGIGATFENLGNDLHNTFFFDDLKTVVPPLAAKSAAAQQEKKNKKPLKDFAPLKAAHNKENPLASIDKEETELQRKCRGMTMAPPSLARLKREQDTKEMSKKYAQMLVEKPQYASMRA